MNSPKKVWVRMKKTDLLTLPGAGLGLLLFALLIQSAFSEKNIVKEFSDEFSWLDSEIPQFNNLVVDKNTGRVYIGAVNKLYQLSPGKNPSMLISSHQGGQTSKQFSG